MKKLLSPLRYPGGKTKIYNRVKNLIISNGYVDRTYVEPFAGGFGIGIGLLSEDVVKRAILNDFDQHIYNFWYSVLNETEGIMRLIRDTPITIDEREQQRLIYHDNDADPLRDGFATLFLNRVNYSGVMKGGPIGGLSQGGPYKIDCRFNKEDVIRRIEAIAKLKGRIRLYNKDASHLIRMSLVRIRTPLFLNIDPPYVMKGSRLYTSFFTEDDHRKLKSTITKHLGSRFPWIITYDDCDLIRDLYKQYHIQEYGIMHNAGGTVPGKEVVITNLPAKTFVW
jgi:DNA adenine methylase